MHVSFYFVSCPRPRETPAQGFASASRPAPVYRIGCPVLWRAAAASARCSCWEEPTEVFSGRGPLTLLSPLQLDLRPEHGLLDLGLDPAVVSVDERVRRAGLHGAV